MIKVENLDTWGFEQAIRGMRNPMNSWDRSDSYQSDFINDGQGGFIIGKNDLELMKKLVDAGHPHRKYLRQIFVSMDIIAPLYWWKEFDTYKVGTVANSCSTMHKIHSKEFTLDDFSHEFLIGHDELNWGDIIPIDTLEYIIKTLNKYRYKYLETKDKKYWWQMVQLLPSSYNQKRTVTMNYENVLNIIQYRTNHKLDEWCEFVEILKTLPYIKPLIL